MLGKHVVNDDVVDDDIVDVNDDDDVDDLSGERVRPDAGERQFEKFRWTVGAEGGERLVLDSKVLRKVLLLMIKVLWCLARKKGTNDDSDITMIRMMMRMRMIRKPEFSAMCLDRHPPELSSRRE